MLLSGAGAAIKAVSVVAWILGWQLPALELDLLPEALSFLERSTGRWAPAGLGALHLPLALTIIRVLFLRVPYAKRTMTMIWGTTFTEIGPVVLVLPLFFSSALTALPLGHFYDGYLRIAQWVYGGVSRTQGPGEPPPRTLRWAGGSDCGSVRRYLSLIGVHFSRWGSRITATLPSAGSSVRSA